MAVDDGITVTAYPRGKVLFRQGDQGDAAYFLNSGAIGLYRESQGRRVPLATVRRGEMFGELAATDATPRLASAVALEDCVVMVIPVATMAAKMRNADGFLRSLVSMLSTNLRNVHETHSPKSRSLLDSVNNLTRQIDVISRFLSADLPPDFRAKLETQLKSLDGAVKDMRSIAMAHRREDRRDDAVPHEADLPA